MFLLFVGIAGAKAKFNSPAWVWVPGTWFSRRDAFPKGSTLCRHWFLALVRVPFFQVGALHLRAPESWRGIMVLFSVPLTGEWYGCH